MTKQEALEMCVRLWTHIRDNNPTSKKESVLALGLSHIKHDCPACHYASEQSSTTICVHCPVEWPNKYCTRTGPFDDWTTARQAGDIKRARKAADEMVKLVSSQIETFKFP